jgi:hypothetical protein
LFIWLVSFNQTNQTDQINKRDQPVLAPHAPWLMAQPELISDGKDACGAKKV